MTELFYTPGALPAQTVIMMSGSGCNAEAVLNYRWQNHLTNFDVAAIATDRVHTSRAAEIARNWDLPLIECDIGDFYQAHGESRVTLATGSGRAVRELWTAEFRRKLAPFKVDFLIFAGFFSLCNLTRDYPALNIHPGDLTVEENGVRLLTGLNAVPVEEALVRGMGYLRSSVILATPYTGSGEGEVDAGPVLGVSEPMYCACNLPPRELEMIRAARKPGVPPRDELRSLATELQDELKHFGDVTVLPHVVSDFASGCFGREGAQLMYRETPKDPFEPVRTVEYAKTEKSLLVD